MVEDSVFISPVQGVVLQILVADLKNRDFLVEFLKTAQVVDSVVEVGGALGGPLKIRKDGLQSNERPREP